MSHPVQLLCPACGHHVGDMTRGEPSRRVASDPITAEVKDFLSVAVESAEGAHMSTQDAYRTYVRWSRGVYGEGDGLMSTKAFGMAMRRLGHKSYRTSTERGYMDLQLI